MRVIDAAGVSAALDYTPLVEALRQAFRAPITAPLRHHHEIPTFGDHPGTLLLMPAWEPGRYLGVKTLTSFPDNAVKGDLPAIQATYLLMSAKTGQTVALIDGTALTLRRTACASALAARYLAREDASRLLMVGTGALAPHLILAHATVRPIRDVLIWGRSSAKAKRLAKRLNRKGLSVSWTEDLPAAVRGAHVISCATRSADPLIEGRWLSRGSHLDLVGGYTPQMREADDEAVKRARVFVDTRDGALAEAGDIIQPIERGVLREDDIAGDLFELTRGERAGRRFYDQITLFKSVGTALEDLAAATLAFRLT
jgi:ornithine cyclodeaminase